MRLQPNTSEPLEHLRSLEEEIDRIRRKKGQVTYRDIMEASEKLREAREVAERLEQQRREEEERLRREEEERRQQEEHILQVTSMDLPMDWENFFAGDSRVEDVYAETIPDGLILSLSNLGRVDIEYISSITGADLKTVICTLKGSIYQNPETWDECFYKGWETADEYLAGNMLQKWKVAREANKIYNGYFSDNVDAIENVLPNGVSTDEIYATLGSPWIPTDIIDQFICHILGLKYTGQSWTSHDTTTGSWEIADKSFYKDRVACRSTYGTERMSFMYLLQDTLNMKSAIVRDEVFCYTTKSGKKRTINMAETTAALEKQQKIIQEFQKWLWRNHRRRQRLEALFDNKYSCVRQRHYDGSFLTFPGMDEHIQLYPYQKNAAARIILSPNTLLAHDVGSGKTYVMIAAGMELRRIGLSAKNLYVVPNNLVDQWRTIFLDMYPNAKLLCVDPNIFTVSKREGVLKAIRDQDFDGIIMAYSCFEQISLSRDYYIRDLEQTRDEIKQLLQDPKNDTAALRRRAKSVDEALFKAVTETAEQSGTVFFDELGITRIFVDEAHNYKNVPLSTKTNRVLGISSGGSQKCQDMLDKVRMIQKLNNGGGVVLATGTPITNSITDIFVMQHYLQSGELALLDLQSFDSWIGMFAERVTAFEVDVDTSSFRLATRFAKFHNLPELTAMLSSIADFHQVDTGDGIPETDGYTDVLIGKTDDFEAYLKTISDRADDVRQGLVDRTEDNMLKITTDGRKAALDLRIVNPDAPFTHQSKVYRCSENVYDIYCKTADRRSTQLIFCDISTPKKGFNIYDETRRLLLNAGIPENEIAFVHDATTPSKRNALFAKVRRGEIRVLMGSTFKLGLGVNVQDKLVAIHHLDVPWRPADMTQREGRILRQGNENKKVQIFRYITEGSFDAYSWQLLETKQRFIVALLSGSMTQRSGSDIEDTVLSYAEVKALAVGNPLVKLRVETSNELNRLLTLQRKAVENHISLEKELMELPARMTHQTELIEKCRQDAAYVSSNFVQQDAKTRRMVRQTIFDAVARNELALKESFLMHYQGFQVILPTNMTAKKPYIWLQRRGRYYVELGESEKGYLIRLDNALEGLSAHGEKLKQRLAEMELRQSALRAELQKTENYAEPIEMARLRLKRIDKELGVDLK